MTATRPPSGARDGIALCARGLVLFACLHLLVGAASAQMKPELPTPDLRPKLKSPKRIEKGEPLPVTDWKSSTDVNGNQPVLAFFPPNPPPLGVAVVQPRKNTRSVNAAPRELADFVGEIFYPALGSRLVAHALNPELRDQIEAYRKKRDALVEEMRNHIYSVAEADAETRLRLNTAFAREQTTRVAELEATAKELWVALLDLRGWGGSHWDWNEHRHWKLGRGDLKREREENALLEYQVMRAAVYYQEGLSIVQRGMLLEAVMTMEDDLFRPDSRPLAEYGFFYFSPEGARVHLPSDVPSDAAMEIEAFVKEKEALTSEVRDAVYEADARRFISRRADDMEALAKKQAERIEALEDLAEEIRRSLMGFAGWKRPPVPKPMPPGLEEMVDRFEKRRDALQDRLFQLALVARNSVPPAVPASGTALSPSEAADYQDALSAAVEQAKAVFEKENQEALLELQGEVEAIAQLITEHLASEDEEALHGSATSVMNRYLQTHRKEQTDFEYHTAALEPGFSPEQRRLLFAAALREMRLPLPGAEALPSRLPGTLLPVDQLGR